MSDLEYAFKFTGGPKEPAIVDRADLRVKRRKLRWLWGILTKKVKVKYHRLAVEVVQIPDSVSVEDLAKLFVLRPALVRGLESNELVEFMITTDVYPVDVVFDPNQIKQYNDISRDDVTFDLDYVMQPRKKGEPSRKRLKVHIEFEKAVPACTCHLAIAPEFTAGLEYEKSTVLLGEVRLACRSPYVHSHSADANVRVVFGDARLEDVVFFGEPREVKESNPRFPKGGLIEAGETPESLTSIQQLSGDAYRIERLYPPNEVTLPVYLDLRRIDNPPEPADFEAVVHWQVTVDGEEREPRSERQPFRIRPDRRTTALRLEVFERDERVGEGSVDRELAARRIWNRTQNASLKCFRVRVGNSAESGEGEVRVRGLRLRYETASGSPSRILAKDGGGLEDVFRIGVEPGSREKAEEMTAPHREGAEFVFPDGEGSYVDLDVSLRHKAVEDIPENIAQVVARVSFEARAVEGSTSVPTLHRDGESGFSSTLQADGESASAEPDSGWEHHDFEVRFEVEKYAGPHWLVVDYGTSATVIGFDRQTSRGVYLLDLQRRLKDIGDISAYTADLIPEYGTPFLSSSILLRNEGSLMADAARDDLIFVAPERFREGGHLLVLPPLKALIGSGDLPRITDAYREVRYSIRNGEEQGEHTYAARPPRVTEIVASTYNRILRDYVFPILEERAAQQGDERELNKVAFTVPNTFTPRHIDILRELVREHFPVFRSEYTTFISESDAVASYYLDHRVTLNDGRSSGGRSHDETFKEDTEYVLIYDMGAGTLDLTYFKIEPVGSEAGGPQRMVTVLGRMGTDTGGNYLDETLARAVYEEYEAFFIRSMFGTTLDPATKKARFRFKHTVEHDIKPALGQEGRVKIVPLTGDEEEYAYLTEPIDVDTKELADNPRLQDYLSLNTDTVLGHFFELFNGVDGADDGSPVFHDKGHFPLHTALLTGRGTQVAGLEGRLRTAISTWAGDRDVTVISDLDAKALKSAVVEGALEFVTRFRQLGALAPVQYRSRNILARYGVLHKDGMGVWRFLELLSPATRSISPEPTVKDSMRIFEYDSDHFDTNPDNDDKRNYADLSGGGECFFVQSYSTDTAADFQKGRTEFITRMFSWTLEETGYESRPHRVPVRVRVDAENRMVVTVGELELDPLEPMRTNLEDSDAFVNGMWPSLDPRD